MKITIGDNEENQRLDKFLRKLLNDVPLSLIYKSLRKKKIKVNGKKAKQNYMLKLKDIIEIYDIQSETKNKEYKIYENYKLDTVFEDENILIVYKEPGILVHSNKKNCTSLTDYVISYLIKKGDYIPKDEITFTPAPCNRLDMNTCGLVMYGKNFNTLQSLNKMIKKRQIKKYYLALVHGKIKDNEYKAYIVKNKVKNISKIYQYKKENSKEIAMRVKNLKTAEGYSLIELELITGRSHQLRAHLSYLGNPIIGDVKYGNVNINKYFYDNYKLKSQFLIAYKLYFDECEKNIDYMRGKIVKAHLPQNLLLVKDSLF